MIVTGLLLRYYYRMSDVLYVCVLHHVVSPILTSKLQSTQPTPDTEVVTDQQTETRSID